MVRPERLDCVQPMNIAQYFGYDGSYPVLDHSRRSPLQFGVVEEGTTDLPAINSPAHLQFAFLLRTACHTAVV